MNKQERRHFHAKTTSAKLYFYIGVGSRDLFISEAHPALGIFPVFFPCMLPTPLCGIFFTYICLTPLGILEKIFLVPLSHLTVLCLQVHLAGHVIVQVPELDGDLLLFTVLALLPGSPFPNLLSNCFLLF